jgi:hypothetical protein
VASSAATTDAQGRAVAGSWILGTVAGSQTLTAQVGGISGQLVATAVAGAAARLEFATNAPASARAGVVLAPTVRVRALDQFNNAITTAGLAITASLVSGPGPLSGNAATTDASGIASFTGLTVGGIVGQRVIGFSAQGAPVLASSSMRLDPGPAATIAVENLPATVRAGVPISPALVASLTDQFGNAVTTPPVNVTVTIEQGGGTVIGGTATSNATGTATFPSLAIGGLVGNRRLRFSAEQAALTTDVIPLFAGDPAAVFLTAQPTDAENTVPIAEAFQMHVADAFQNPVGGVARPITATLTSGGGSMPPVIQQSNAAGLASFTGLTLTGVIGPRRITFSSPGLASAVSAPINLVAGPVRGLSFVQAPSGAITAGVPIPQQPAIQLSDTSGNIVRRPGIHVRAALLDITGELVNDVAISDNAGLATFAQLTVLPNSGVQASMRLRFGSGGQASLVSGNLTVTPAGASAVAGVSYGVPSQRLFILDAGNTLPLIATAQNGGGQPLPVPIVYTSSNAAVASVASNGTITGVTHGSAWVGAFGAGAPGIRDSVYVTVPRDPTGPIVSTTQLTPVPVRAGFVSTFDVLLDTRGATIGAATIVVGLPPELVNNIAWQGAQGAVIGFDHQFNALRISIVSTSGLTGIVAIANVQLTSGPPAAFFVNREIVITPLEVITMSLQDLAPRTTGVNIPLIP